MQAVQTKNPTHTATLNGASVNFNAEDYDDVVATLVAEHGPGVPKIVELTGPAAKLAPAPEINVGEYDAAGDARSQSDRDAAVAAGFSPKQPLYRQGSRATGMREHREEFERMPMARAAATQLIERVKSEGRDDLSFRADAVRLNNVGMLALGRARLAFTLRSFGSLVSRLGMPNGASTYLPAIEPQLRAVNVNHWVEGPFTHSQTARAAASVMDGTQPDPTELVFRTRKAPRNGRECYAVVSGSYGEFDADRIAEAVRLACPPEARARVVYDGHRTKFDVVFFSNIVPEHAVAGEFFQAAVQIRTDDSGGGSIVVSAALHQNLCLNFIILDKAVGEAARIRHVGSTEKLAKKFREAFTAALKKIEHFTAAWGYAQEEDAAARALAAAKQTSQITKDELDAFVVRPVSEVLPGIFNGLIERELVPLPKRNRAETVKQLMAMWKKDESAATRDRQGLLTRAAVVNAVTRYAHEVNENPFLESDIEDAGGALLFGRQGEAPAPLPFVPLPA